MNFREMNPDNAHPSTSDASARRTTGSAAAQEQYAPMRDVVKLRPWRECSPRYRPDRRFTPRFTNSTTARPTTKTPGRETSAPQGTSPTAPEAASSPTDTAGPR